MPSAIEIDLVLPGIKAHTARQVLETLTKTIIERTSLPLTERGVLDRLVAEDKETSFAMGEGLAIPNLRMKELKSRVVILATLANPIDFQATDGQPARIACALFSPESDGNIHLRGLSRISRLLKDKRLQQNLLETDDAETIRSLVTDPDGWLMAA